MFVETNCKLLHFNFMSFNVLDKMLKPMIIRRTTCIGNVHKSVNTAKDGQILCDKSYILNS